ncbi:hypothetical protein [Thermomonospora echinospora]|uniref:hypothetical protein n=1 Tax=Thermomonospora echinospora TaxID=1992 RepID=UPI0011B0E963|nr:hypothetical protein [Thermomonospora echinospora]
MEFSDLRVRSAVEFIEQAGIADELQALITKPTGRPRTCTVLGLLVGLTLACRRTEGSAVPLNLVTDILHWGIPDHWRRRFALKDRPDNARGFEAAYAVVLRLFHDLRAAMDPSPLPKNRRLPRDEAARLTICADHDDLEARQALLDRVTNQILEASSACVRHLLDEHWDGSLGVDATVIATFARGTRTKGPLTSTDPDAGWYVRDGDHADPDHPNPAAVPLGPTTTSADKRKNKNKMVFGYDLTLAVARNPHHDPSPRTNGCGDPAKLPALIMGMRLGRPGHNPGTNGIAVLTGIRRRGHPAGHLAADAAYNNSKPEDWQLPLRALGYRPAYSYRQDQLGVQAQAHGARMVEGTWYCPHMPDQLVTATQDLHRPSTDPAAIDPATWRVRIDARAPYALPAKGRPDAEGHQRCQCPATAGKVQCALKPASLGTDPRLPLVDVQPSPVAPPKICTQTSVTFAPEYGAKHWQAHPYGSAVWQKIYGRLRNATEGINGYAKNDARESIERSQGRRVRGIAAQALLLAFQLAHVNIRKINAWRDTMPGPDGHPRRRARRRTSKPLGTWTPKGHLDNDPAA